MNLMTDNIINIDKPAGWTSFDVVNKIRGITHIKKVGHAGTLDPFATGVLLVLTGNRTKQQSEFTSMGKIYFATLRLGQQTDTGDFTGEIITEMPVPDLDPTELDRQLRTFVGETMQIPPMYSAKKVNGKKLYKLARKGQTVDREPHPIMIYSIKIIDVALPTVTLEIHCGKGTYIRTLAEDIASKIGTCAHLTALRRLAIGEYSVETAETIQTFEERWISCAA